MPFPTQGFDSKCGAYSLSYWLCLSGKLTEVEIEKKIDEIYPQITFGEEFKTPYNKGSDKFLGEGLEGFCEFSNPVKIFNYAKANGGNPKITISGNVGSSTILGKIINILLSTTSEENIIQNKTLDEILDWKYASMICNSLEDMNDIKGLHYIVCKNEGGGEYTIWNSANGTGEKISNIKQFESSPPTNKYEGVGSSSYTPAKNLYYSTGVAVILA